MPKLRVIVGQGTAAEVFIETRERGDWETVVVGPRGLWAALPQDHRMGQTPELLHLPGQPLPAHTTADGRTAQGMQGFMRVDNFQQGLLALAARHGMTGRVRRQSGGVALDRIHVTAISERQVGGQLIVTTSEPGVVLLADQVVLATGIGPQRKIPAQIITGEQDPLIPFTQIMEGVEFLDSPPERCRSIAIYGGSATAAWVVDKALAEASELIWFTRPGGSEFNGCTLPGNRNAQVLEKTRDKRVLADLVSVTYLRTLPPAVGRRRNRFTGRLMLKLRRQDGGLTTCFVDRLIHSIGGDPTAIGGLQSLLDNQIKEALSPILDVDRVLGAGDGVLAIGTPSRNVLIVGAGVYNYGALNVGPRSAPMASLPTASQVPDGIAMIVASESALNNFVPINQTLQGEVTDINLNLNLADRNQLAIYLALFYPDLGPHAANEIVVRAISLRSSKRPNREFGLDWSEFETIIEQYV